MERRGFLKGLAALVGGIALEQAVPFGRVWSFPKEIKRLNFSRDAFLSLFPIGTMVHIRFPQVFFVRESIENGESALQFPENLADLKSRSWSLGELGIVKNIRIDSEINVPSYMST